MRTSGGSDTHRWWDLERALGSALFSERCLRKVWAKNVKEI